MQYGLNEVNLIGVVGKDPVLKIAKAGGKIVRISIATNERLKNYVTKETSIHTEWHQCVLWGVLAENACLYLKKGSVVYIKGRIRTKVDPNERQYKEIHCKEIKYLINPYNPDLQSSKPKKYQKLHSPDANEMPPEEFSDEIPF